MRTVARFWRWLEYTSWRLRRWMRRRQREIEAQLYAFGQEVWNLVDEFPTLGPFHPIPPIRSQYYAHGSFMGAAPALLDDPRWRKILAFLMPDVFHDVSEAVRKGARHGKIIPMFENNPVMAAYGTWRSAEIRARGAAVAGPHDLSGHEWDIFVDGELTGEWERAALEQRPWILRRIVDTMLVAHATSTDTLQEHVGLCQYADVRRTRKTAMGGVEAPAWLDLFARALALADAPDLHAALKRMRGDLRYLHAEECREHTFVHRWPVSAAVEQYRRVAQRPHLSVVLEVKSLRTTPALLSDIVVELNRRGLHVSAVGSFSLDEIRGVNARPQRVNGDDLPGPREILFFHTAGDLQAACDAGKIEIGQHALFNGASLLELDKEGYRVEDGLLAEIETYRVRHGLVLGFYVQEGDCDAAAAATLARISDTHAGTFELGFAWGGLQDEAAVITEGRDRRGFGSQKMLVTMGLARRWRFTTDAAPGAPEAARDPG